ncbi:MAG: hypothetical protein DWQ02_23900 [Bacteroidetes bacterium]|nr:MAG: hypothetical protein DWQ02_23900 [Bacteroidota bacterium]
MKRVIIIGCIAVFFIAIIYLISMYTFAKGVADNIDNRKKYMDTQQDSINLNDSTYLKITDF